LTSTAARIAARRASAGRGPENSAASISSATRRLPLDVRRMPSLVHGSPPLAFRAGANAASVGANKSTNVAPWATATSRIAAV
jgi:hypothetical protein